MLTVDNVKVARDILLRSYNYCRNRIDECCSYLMQEEDESGTEYECAYYGNGRCKKGMLDDAIELLKEQEPKPIAYTDNPNTGLPVAHCPKCGKFARQFDYYTTIEETHFCPWCGQKVKW